MRKPSGHLLWPPVSPLHTVRIAWLSCEDVTAIVEGRVWRNLKENALPSGELNLKLRRGRERGTAGFLLSALGMRNQTEKVTLRKDRFQSPERSSYFSRWNPLSSFLMLNFGLYQKSPGAIETLQFPSLKE